MMFEVKKTKLARDIEFDVKSPEDLDTPFVTQDDLMSEYSKLWEYSQFLLKRLSHSESERFKELDLTKQPSIELQWIDDTRL